MEYLSATRRVSIYIVAILTVFTSVCCTPKASLLQVEEWSASKLIGAWTSTITYQGSSLTQVAILDEAYMSISIFDQQRRTFHGTYGGQWQLEGDWCRCCWNLRNMGRL
ncbi:MAG: hypothetical protein AAFO02_24200 [Bacteroidota bacterium]